MIKPVPRRPLVLRFDPAHCEDKEVVAVFANDLARSLWLIFAPGHLMGPDFAGFCLACAAYLKKHNPEDALDLYNKIRMYQLGEALFRGSSLEESEEFLNRLLQALRGIKPLKYKVVLPDTPEDRMFRSKLRRHGLHDGLMGKMPSIHNASYHRGFSRGARIWRRIREAPEPMFRYA